MTHPANQRLRKGNRVLWSDSEKFIKIISEDV